MTVFAVSTSTPPLFRELERDMTRGWWLRSCGTAMGVEPLRVGMLLPREEVVVVVLVTEVEAAVLLPRWGKEEGRDVGSIPKLVPSLVLRSAGAEPAWVDVTEVPDADTKPDDANDTLAPLTSWLFSPLPLLWRCSDVGVLSPEEMSMSAAPTSAKSQNIFL